MIEPKEIFDRQYECEWDKLNKLEIDITNPTGLPQFINLFAYSLQNVATQYPSLVFSDPVSYDILVQDLEYSPIKARKILFASAGQGQLANPVFVKSKYADGTESGYNEFPIISVDTHQRQGNRVEVVFDELILDSFTSFSNYRINAGETVTVLLFYRQLKRWCIIEYPELFPKRKPITKEITNEISKEFCEREGKFKKQDTDSKCKQGQKQYELQITNNGIRQAFVNLFDNYSLTPSEDLTAPVNTLITNAGADFSYPKFEQWLSGNKEGYTIGGAGLFEIIRYDSIANFTIEFTIGAALPILQFSISNVNNLLYYTHTGASANLFIYALGSGAVPSSVVIGGSPDSMIVDDVNNYVFILRQASATIVRLNQATLATTTFATVSPPSSQIVGYFSATNEVIYEIPTAIRTLYGMNALTGVSTLRDTFLVTEIVGDMVDLPDLGCFAIILASAFAWTVKLYDSSYNVIGTYTSATNLDVISYDSTRQELVVPENGGANRLLFFTKDSLANNTFDSFFTLGFPTNNTGYLSDSQTVLIGRKGAQSVSTLNRSPTIEFSRPESYDYFTESLGEEPVKVSCMDIIAQTQQQLVNNLVIQTKDADGHIHSRPKSPIVKVDTFQEQAGRSFLEMDETLILNGNTTFASYPLDAGETVTMIFYYHQFKRASILSQDNQKRIKIQMPEPIIDYGKLDEYLNYEKHECAKYCKKIEIKVTNSTGIDSPFNFFVANQTQLIVNQINATFDNVEDYNFLIQQLRTSPLVLCGIEFIGANQNQLTEPVIINTRDADGDSIAYQHFPINFVDTNQQDGSRAFIKINHLTLDGYNIMPLYNIRANSSITLVIYYRQFLRSDFLNTHVFPRLKKPIVANGSQLTEDIEYYNEVSEVADNTWDFEGTTKKGNQKIVDNPKKSVIFGAEQVFSDGLVSNRSDFMMPFYKKVRVKFSDKRANCDISKPDKQILYVNPNDLSFGKEKDFPVVDISQQGFNQFDDKLTEKHTIQRCMIDEGYEDDSEIAYRDWKDKDKEEEYKYKRGDAFIKK